MARGEKARFIVSLFAKQRKDKFTDEQLAKELDDAYPEQKGKWRARIQRLRREYNAGLLSCQDTPPKQKCLKYFEDGSKKDNSRPRTSGPATAKKSTKKSTKKAAKKSTKKAAKKPARKKKVVKAS